MGNAKLRGEGYYSQFEIDYKPIDPLNLSLEFKRDISPNYMQYVDITYLWSNYSDVTKKKEFFPEFG